MIEQLTRIKHLLAEIYGQLCILDLDATGYNVATAKRETESAYNATARAIRDHCVIPAEDADTDAAVSGGDVDTITLCANGAGEDSF